MQKTADDWILIYTERQHHQSPDNMLPILRSELPAAYLRPVYARTHERAVAAGILWCQRRRESGRPAFFESVKRRDEIYCCPI